MRWVIRTGAVIIITALVVLTPFAAAPAEAARAKPAPVDAFPELPRTITRITAGHPNGPPLGSPSMSAGRWGKAKVSSQKLAAARAKTGGAPVQVPGTPITKAGTFAKLGALGGIASTGWFAVGAVGAGTGVMGNMFGVDLDASMCSGEQWLQDTYGVLTMGMGPSCKVGFIDPNAGLSEGWTAEGYGLSLVGYDWAWVGNQSNTFWRSILANSTASGLSVSARGSDGVWYVLGNVPGGATGYSASLISPYAAQFFQSQGYQLCQDTATACGGSGARLLTMGQTSADPLRDAQCTLTWEDGSTTTGFIGQYRESEGFPIGAVDASCTEAYVSKPGAGPDLLPTEIKVGSTNTEDGSQTEIASQEVEPFTEEERVGLRPGDGSGLKLWKITSGVTDSCMTWAANCAGWWTDTDAGTQSQTATGEYRCTWGGATVDLPECGVYRFTFDVETDDPTITDPDTEEQIEWTNTDTDYNSTDPSSGPTPGEQCMDEWSSVPNPVEWVVHPIKCALVWAFVPRAEVVQDAWSNASMRWNLTMPARIAVLTAGAFEIDPISGCLGPHIYMDFSTFWDGWPVVDWYPIAACEEPTASVAMWSRWISSAILVWLTALGIVRRASATVNAPGLGGGS